MNNTTLKELLNSIKDTFDVTISKENFEKYREFFDKCKELSRKNG